MTVWATGMRAAAPALVFQAEAVMPAARRSGMTTPCAPNAAALRIAAPRLRGSVTWSRATISGGSPSSLAALEQVVGVGVLVRRDPRGQPLVDRAAGHPVELALGDLEQADAALAGQPERLAEPAVALGALGDVHAVDRHALAQRLDHRVAAGDPLGVAGVAPLRPRGGGLGRLLLRGLVGLVVGPVLGLRRRAPALEAALDPAAGARRSASWRSCGSSPCAGELPGI